MIYVKIKDSHIIYNESKPAVLSHIAKVSKESVAPRFEKGDTQGRIEKQLNVISSIRDNFNSELMFGHEGSFQGIPIITYDGRVVSGNHRAEAIKTMQDECATRYISEVAKHYGISISKDEMIVRLLPQGTADDVIKEMAYISNVGRESTLGERALINNVRYADGLASLPKYIQSESIDELQCIVARHLDKASNGLNIFDANLALFCDVVGIDTEGNGIMESFDKIHNRDPEVSKKLKDLLVGNAGALWNIKNDDRVRNIELDKYLGRAVQVLAGTKGNKLQNAEALNKEIQSFLELTDAGRESALALAPTLLDDFKAFALATALLKFVWQENPAGAFYDFLKDFIEILDNIVSPSLISEGKPLYEANIFDTVKIFLAQGRMNSVVSESISLMERLEELSFAQEFEEVEDNTGTEVVEIEGDFDNLFSFAGVDLNIKKGVNMQYSNIKNKLENHDYLNIGVKSVFDMLALKRDFEQEHFIDEINKLRRYCKLDDIDYALPPKPTRTKDEIMGDLSRVKFTFAKYMRDVSPHEYIVKNRNCKRELYEELYSLIFYEFNDIIYKFNNYYKVIDWQGRNYWIMNSDIRFSVVINRDYLKLKEQESELVLF